MILFYAWEFSGILDGVCTMWSRLLWIQWLGLLAGPHTERSREMIVDANGYLFQKPIFCFSHDRSCRSNLTCKNLFFETQNCCRMAKRKTNLIDIVHVVLYLMLVFNGANHSISSTTFHQLVEWPTLVLRATSAMVRLLKPWIGMCWREYPRSSIGSEFETKLLYLWPRGSFTQVLQSHSSSLGTPLWQSKIGKVRLVSGQVIP